MSQVRIFIADDAHAAWTTTAQGLGITAEQLITSVGRLLLVDPDGPVPEVIRAQHLVVSRERRERWGRSRLKGVAKGETDGS